jgi:hypothetical protein
MHPEIRIIPRSRMLRRHLLALAASVALFATPALADTGETLTIK